MWCFHKFNQKEQHRSSFCSCKLTSSRAFLSTYLLPAFDNPIVYAWSEQQQKRPALVSIHWFCWVQYRLLIFWNMTLQHGRKAFRRRTADRLAAPSDFSNWGKLRFLLLSGLIYFCMSLLSFLCVILKVTVMTRCFKRTLTLLWVQAVAAPFDKKHWTSFLFALTILDLNLKWQRLAGISTGHLRNLPAQSRATYSQLLRTTARKFWLFQVTSQAPWATCDSPGSLSQWKPFPYAQTKPSRCAELGQSHSQRGQATQNKAQLPGLS